MTELVATIFGKTPVSRSDRTTHRWIIRFGLNLKACIVSSVGELFSSALCFRVPLDRPTSISAGPSRSMWRVLIDSDLPIGVPLEWWLLPSSMFPHA